VLTSPHNPKATFELFAARRREPRKRRQSNVWPRVRAGPRDPETPIILHRSSNNEDASSCYSSPKKNNKSKRSRSSVVVCSLGEY
jgi:hypothetical protein